MCSDAATSSPYLPIREFADVYLWPRARTLRHWLLTNPRGFRQRCARKIGRSVVLDVAAVWAWIDEADMDQGSAR